MQPGKEDGGQIKQMDDYNNLFQSVMCGIVQYRLTNEKAVFKKANREAVRIFGYSQEEFWSVGEWAADVLIAEEDRAYILGLLRKLRRPGDKISFEYRLLQKGGTPCWIIGSAELIVDVDGEEVIQSVYLDINERKNAEQRSRRLSEQLEASNEILHLALEHTTTCEIYYYPETKECIVPKRTCQIYHCRERYDDMPCSFAKEHVDEETRPDFYEMYRRIQDGAHTASCEFKILEGGSWCRETMSVIQTGENGRPKLVIGIVENITKQKEME
ncbi:PAS domain-containing protein, partial [[Clostridium] hylemonae]